MTGSTIARVLVALCIGSAVTCMPNGTRKSRRQAQQHHVSSVSQGTFSSASTSQTVSLLPAVFQGTLWTVRSLKGFTFAHFWNSNSRKTDLWDCFTVLRLWHQGNGIKSTLTSSMQSSWAKAIIVCVCARAGVCVCARVGVCLKWWHLDKG